MKISIIPDIHSGYGRGTIREDDSFVALEEAIEKNLDADLIVLTGDVFDSRVPKQETFAKVARILVKAQNIPSTTKFIDVLGKDKKSVSPSALKGLPIIALHGNHDRRSKHMINPVQALEHAGLLIHLHCGTIIFDVHGKKVAIHGMSNVPEKYARDVLYAWNPKPVPDAINILILHQSIDPYIYSPLDPPSIKLEDLPSGFDLIVNGHLHWHDIKTLGGSIFLLAGSLIPTIVHKKESEQKKGYHIYDGSTVEFRSIENQRRVYFEDLYFNENLKHDLKEKLSCITSKDSGKMKPIININIKGTLPTGARLHVISDVINKYKDKAVIKIKRKIREEGFDEEEKMLRLLMENRLSPEEQGIVLLKENMKHINCNINVDEIFDLLLEGDTDKVFSLISG